MLRYSALKGAKRRADEVSESGAPVGVPSFLWKPRPYQREWRDAFDSGLRKQLIIAHRRAGKDDYSMDHARRELDAHGGTVWHMFPIHVQARRSIFEGHSKDGVRFIDRHFPHRIGIGKQDMAVELPNGAFWRMLGSDLYDRLPGGNPIGVIFSEWSRCDPRAWQFVKPIIRENGGWAIFITTFYGRNHAYKMVQDLRGNSEWYVDLKDVTQTTLDDGSPVISEADIAAERAEGMSEELIQQEYYNNPLASAEGSYYGRALDLIGRRAA